MKVTFCLSYFFLLSSENFLQVKVFYEQLNYEKVTERISYEVIIISKLQ